MPDALKTAFRQGRRYRPRADVSSTRREVGYLDGQSKHDVTKQSIEANAKIIEKTGEDAAVLKNEGRPPLKAADLSSVVLIGPTSSRSTPSASTVSARWPARAPDWPSRRHEENLR